MFSETVLASANTSVYFSPKGGCEEAVVKLIAGSHTRLDIAVYSINNTAILKALDDAKARGVTIRILTDHVQAAGNASTTLELDRKGYDLRLHSVGKIMHDKFVVADEKRVETGSFNWTNPAEQVNEENCLVLDESETVSKYEHQFTDHLWVVNTLEKSRKHLAKIKERVAKRAVANDSHDE
jgi:phosphatidylserine/phosphatidylglycerophosphate/cardiolipin synthase-like enzyme